MPLEIRPPQFRVDFAFDERPMRDRLSDVPDQWDEAEVTDRNLAQGVALRKRDGAYIVFNSVQCVRNRTGWENTQVGATVWITERYGISAFPPDPRSPRQCYDDMMAAHVKQFSDAVDAQAAKEILE